MTIGIILKFSSDKNGTKDQGIITIADRMVSFGAQGIEYPISKIETLMDGNLTAVGIGSGYDHLITEFFNLIRMKINDGQVKDFNDLSKRSLSTYSEIIQERVETEIFQPYKINLQDIQGRDFNEALFSRLYEKAGNLINEITTTGLDAIIGGVDSESAYIWAISQSTRMDESHIGFDVTGSGSMSASWTIIHKGFDQTKGMLHALVIGLAAKFQAEESLGVGRSTEVKIVRKNQIITLTDDTINKIRQIIEVENKRQEEEMQKIIKSVMQYGIGKGNEKRI